MAKEEQIRVKITADNKQFVTGMKQATQAQAKFTKGNKRQSQSFTQLSYALDDAQYGFRGVQNNLQQLAVTAGASGLVVLALTAVVIAIGYLIENVDLFKDSLKETGKEVSKLLSVSLSKDAQLSAAAKKHNVELDKQIKKTEELHKQFKKGVDREEELAFQIQGYKLEKAINNAIIEGVNQRIIAKDVAQRQKLIDEGRATNLKEAARILTEQNASFTEINGAIAHSVNLAKANKEESEDILKLELDQLEKVEEKVVGAQNYEKVLKRIAILQAKIANPEVKTTTTKPEEPISNVGLSDDQINFDKFEANLATVNQLFEDGKIGLDEYIDRVENLSLAFDELSSGALAGVSLATEDVTIDLQSLGASLIQTAAEGGDVGQQLLAGIGATMIQLGTQLVLVGIGVEAFKISLSSLNGPAAIAAGVALIALGATFTSIASKAAGSGGTSTQRNNQGGAVSDVSSTQGGGFNQGQLVARVSGQDLRFVLQAADDSYAGLN